jgi:hypothetical protein
VPQPGQVWAARYHSGAYVAVTIASGARAKVVPVAITPQGAVSQIVGRERWVSHGQIHKACRLTKHVLQEAL